MILKRQNLVVILLLLTVLGGYAFFLQQSLSAQERPEGFVRSKGFKGMEVGTEGDRVKSIQRATSEEAALVKKTQQLAEEVAGLAKAMKEQQVDKISIKGLQVGKAEKGAQASPDEKKQAADAMPIEKPRLHVGPLTSAEVERRRLEIRDATAHSWNGYVQHAWGYDELMPKSQRGKNSFGGLGVTILDSLDTLWLMDLKDAFQEARDWVASELDFDRSYDASVFETTIRVLGGMLSAYELSGDAMFLRRSKELAEKLLHAFDTPTGIPWNTLNLRTLAGKNPTWTQRSSTLSEFGTEQLEFIVLSQTTNDPSFARASENVIKYIHEHFPDKALLPLYLNPQSGKFTTAKVSMGAMGDSYYEYLLKVWILKGKKEDMYREMWEKAMDEMIAKMVGTSPDGLTYVAEIDRAGLKKKMDHLACFIPAMLALGAHAGAVSGKKADAYMELAANLTYTCWQMYDRHPTGLAPEFVRFTERGMLSGAHHNLLRPEAMEAMFVLWRVTKEDKYREWAWAMFSAWQTFCKVEAGYVGLKDVQKNPPLTDDTMQSFWLAETLKYPFLMYSPDSLLSLDEWVFNTEAHPLRIMPSQ